MHLEYIKRAPKPPVLAPNLVLAGDIGKINTPGWSQFIEYCAKSWDHIFYVFGNHEFYHSSKSLIQLKSDYVQYFSQYPNIHLLDNSDYDLNGLKIYGFVGWTRSPFISETQAKDEINDYNYIWESKNKLISCQYINELANEELDKFKTWTESHTQTNPSLIITHFPPISSGTSNPIYLDQPRQVNSYFSWNNLIKSEHIDSTNINTWVSGHTHWSYGFIDPETDIRYISNQIGYLNEISETKFNPGLIIEI